MGEPRKVGLVYDEKMCSHRNPDLDEYHPENPNRIRAIWNTLQASPKNILQRCVVYEAKEAEDKHILLAHSKNHVKMIKNISSEQFDPKRKRLASKYNSIYFNEGSSQSAYLAAGSVLSVTEKVANGELNSAMAIVRPPGHHAEWDEPMGFCLFNNVAVATKYILDERPELGVKKILIVDWDVHHGNGTQKMFWDDPRVLFFSVHRHEFGSFYPANDDGNYTMTGEGPGAGYNINVPWENGRCGDADYFAAWDHVLLPVTSKFDPDMIIVSAGFDAAVGDPLGGCRVTPSGYSAMLKKLMKFANGKVVLALEGGYNLESIANSTLACVEALLEEEDKTVVDKSLKSYPFESTWRVVKAVRKELSPFWPILAKELPAELTNQITPAVPFAPSSSSDSDTDDRAQNATSINFEEALQDIIKPLSMLKVDEGVGTSSGTWRSELSKTDVWYASFGSNLWLTRFLCYIHGGQVEGMGKPCRGAEDKTAPKEIAWKKFPHRLFFGRERTMTWGEGGVAFVDPVINTEEKTHMCLYKITLEQFNDVLLQENGLSAFISSPLFGLTDLSSLTSGESGSKEVNIERCWYPNVVYLGKQSDVPILTMTCSSNDAKGFKSGELPLKPPPEKYVDTLVRGLVEGKQLSKTEAVAYIQQAFTRPLI